MPDYIFPVLFDGATITSGIGPRNTGIAGASRNHMGIDIAAPRGSPVVAPVSGVVISASSGVRGFGNLVEIMDGSGQVHRFGHLDGFNVSPDQMLMAGQQLGTVGSTGVSSGNHLHYEVRDAAGNLLRSTTREVVSSGRRLIGEAINGLADSNPITKAANKLFGGIFGGDVGEQVSGQQDCGINPICYLENWLDRTGFVQRSALYTLGIILIIGGIAFLAIGYRPDKLAVKALDGVTGAARNVGKIKGAVS